MDEVIEQARFPVIFMDETLYSEATAIFRSLDKRATSMTDCANVAVIRCFSIPQIFSFDKAYRNAFEISMVQS